MQMTRVQQLLDQKGRRVWSTDPDATVFDAISKMTDKDIGSLVVMVGEQLVGIITERRYTRNVFLKGRASPTTLVRDIMEDVITVRPQQSLTECMALMTEKRVRHLPVLDGERLVGIVSIGDLLKSVIDDEKFVIDQLEHYIHG